jgi:hypothetical protein
MCDQTDIGDGWSIAAAKVYGWRAHVFDRATACIKPVPEPLRIPTITSRQIERRPDVGKDLILRMTDYGTGGAGQLGMIASDSRADIAGRRRIAKAIIRSSLLSNPKSRQQEGLRAEGPRSWRAVISIFIVPHRAATGGQQHVKDRSLGLTGGGPEAPTMTFYDRAADRQPHPHAMRFGREERVEDAIDILWIDPRSGISHLDQYVTKFI